MNFFAAQKMKRKQHPSSEEENARATKKQKIDIVNIDDDDEEDDELKQAIQLSLQSSTSTTSSKQAAFVPQFSGTSYYLNETKYSTPSIPSVSMATLLDLQHLKSCFFTTYSFTVQYLAQILQLDKPSASLQSITLVKHYAKPDKQGKTMLQVGKAKIPMCIVHPTLLNTYSNMHAKLWLLEFDTFLRLVITSSNLTPGDWECYTQSVWVQDFGKKQASAVAECAFERDLIAFWTSCTDGIPGKWLQKYDFSTAKAQLVTSIPGYHSGSAFNLYGLKRIGQLLKNSLKGATTSKNTTTTTNTTTTCWFQSSTIGSVDGKWCQETAKEWNVGKLNLIFPSKKCAQDSAYGSNGAGMIHMYDE